MQDMLQIIICTGYSGGAVMVDGCYKKTYTTVVVQCTVLITDMKTMQT